MQYNKGTGLLRACSCDTKADGVSSVLATKGVNIKNGEIVECFIKVEQEILTSTLMGLRCKC